MPNMLKSPIAIVTLLVGICGVLLVLYAWRLPPFTTAVEVTDNAYVRGYVTTLSPQVSGYVVDVPVRDYQTVEAGTLLAKIDDRIYQQRLAQARATLDSQKAALANSHQSEVVARANIASSEAAQQSAEAGLRRAQLAWERVVNLSDRGIASQSETEQAQATLTQAQAAVNQAKAGLEVSRQNLQSIIVNRASLEANVSGAEAAVHLAEIDLGNTAIAAPRKGRLGEVGVRVGQYVAAGTQLMALVPDEVWIIANYKETQIEGMGLGQPASFTVDALGRRRMTGRVERFSPAAGSEFAVIRPDNATGNFTKVAQRIGVRIAIDRDQPGFADLSPGMSVVVSIDKELAEDRTPKAP